MQTESGILSVAPCGGLCLTIAEDRYLLTRTDIHDLLCYGQRVPLVQRKETVYSDGTIVAETRTDGHISVHPSGRAVIAVTRTKHVAIPFIRFQEVARGEVSVILISSVSLDHAGGFY